MNKKLQKVTERILRLPEVKSFGVIGDPGCEGLGIYNMKVYAGALEESSKDDITLIAGDLVPAGNHQFYRAISLITEEIAENDVYVLRGNHDTGEYEEYFGFHNYAIIADGFAIIVVDNAMRAFENTGLALVREVLAMEDVERAVLAFHIPVPNHFIRNSVSEEEFERLREAYTPWKEKVKYLLFGHVHSRFVDEIDGIPCICTGGGGAMIEDVSDDIRAWDVEHHIVHFFMKGGELQYRIVNLSEDCYKRERKNRVLKDQLEETVKNEMMAHLKYMIFSDRAKRRGAYEIANLFEALAKSEYHHARNFYSVLERPAAFQESVKTFIPQENFEYEQLYPLMAAYADQQKAPLARRAYAGASVTEKVHAALLSEAQSLETFCKSVIYVCSTCGHVMTGEGLPKRCPVCGSPEKRYEKFTADSTGKM